MVRSPPRGNLRERSKKLGSASACWVSGERFGYVAGNLRRPSRSGIRLSRVLPLPQYGEVAVLFSGLTHLLRIPSIMAGRRAVRIFQPARVYRVSLTVVTPTR